MCGILLQDKEVVSCSSKTLKNAQSKLTTIEHELFAFVFTCRKFRVYLNGHPYWDPPMNDPLELCPFLEYTVFELPDIVKHFYASFDFEEMNKFNVQPIENPANNSVEINGVHKIFVPNDLWRAFFFWAAHFALHHGQVDTARVRCEKNSIGL